MRMLSYIDPGAGSMILQALAGGVAGVMVAGKLYWGRDKRVLRLGRRESPADQSPPWARLRSGLGREGLQRTRPDLPCAEQLRARRLGSPVGDRALQAVHGV